jgi:hypothetical protein
VSFVSTLSTCVQHHSIFVSFIFSYFIHFHPFNEKTKGEILTQTFLYISENIEVTVEFLTEIDKLVQLIESPIFTCKYVIFIYILFKIYYIKISFH